MLHNFKSRALAWIAGTGLVLAAGAMAVTGASAQDKEPIKIGFSMSLTGPLAANGKMSLVAMQVWEDDIKEGAGLETWKGMSYQTVLTPPALATGKVIYPYEKAK